MKPIGNKKYINIHQTGLDTIFVKINKLKNGTSAFQPACPDLLKIIKREIRTTNTERPKKDNNIIGIRPNSFGSSDIDFSLPLFSFFFLLFLSSF